MVIKHPTLNLPQQPPTRRAMKAQWSGQYHPPKLPKPFPAFLMDADLRAPAPPPEWEVEPLFCQGDRVMFYGHPGACKSWLLMHLGLHLAAGQTWLGKFGVSKPRKVFYLDEEMGKNRTQRRYGRLVEGASIQPGIPFQAWSRFGFAADEEGPQRLLNHFQEVGWLPDVMIIEALRRVLVGAENNAEDIAAFWRHMNPLTEAGITIIISHHMQKRAPQKSGHGFSLASGSGDLLAAIDVGFAVYRETATGPAEVEQTKARDDEKQPPFVVSLDFGPERTSPISMYFGGPVGAELVGPKVDQAARCVMQYLADQPDHTAKRETLIETVVSQGIGKSTAERALKKLEVSEYIRPAEGQKGYWQIAEEFLPMA